VLKLATALLLLCRGCVFPASPGLLGRGSSADVQQNATGALMNLAFNADNHFTITSAGAIPALVQLLRPGSGDLPKEYAVRSLHELGHKNVKIQAAIVAAGASADVDVLEEMERLLI
jgi:hypothetical protein